MRRDAIPELIPPAAQPAAAGVGAWLAWSGVVVAMACVIAAYWSTFASMVDTWSRSQTFAHGFAVPPIAAWIIFRKRAELAQVALRPQCWMLVPVLLAGLVWFAGDLAEANVLRQFAALAILVLVVPVIAGKDATRLLAFPLAFLFFAVPFGEFLLPPLMRWTAFFTVGALRLSGIPVYQEGLRFVIPSGSWSVVEACSGVRYLVASAMVGTLFAYLNYRSTRRRVAFVAVALAVPIVANWVRAYMIVMLAHLTNNRLAAGVDHLIYGWVFFGFVMLLMFWIGARWREDTFPSPSIALRAGAASRGALQSGGIALALALFVTFAVAPVFSARVLQHDGGAARVVTLNAVAPPGWVRIPDMATDWRPRYRDPSAARFDTFSRDGAIVGLYVALYQDQTGQRKLVSSDNVLVPSEVNTWYVSSSASIPLSLGHVPAQVRAAELRNDNPGHERLRVWQWFWVDDHLTTSEALASAYTALARVLGRGDAAAVVVLVTPMPTALNARARADALLQAFARDAADPITTSLRAAAAH